MTTYEITAVVRPDLAPAYERYMRDHHIPDVLATGEFTAASFGRSAPGRYRVRYEARDRTSLDRYLADHAPELRADFAKHFPDGVELSREEWEMIEGWGVQPGAAGRPV